LVYKSRRDSPSRYVLLVESAFKRGSDQEPNHSFLHLHLSFNHSAPSATALVPSLCSPQTSSHAMAASHPHQFQSFVADKNEIRKLIASHFLPDYEVLQQCPAVGEDILAPNTNEIVVFTSFFQRGFGLLVYDLLRGLLDHYQIELVHLNPNSILQIANFVHLCEAYLGIPPIFPLFKNYFFLKYQSSAANQKVIDGVGL
jgi:hypothetical protein